MRGISVILGISLLVTQVPHSYCFFRILPELISILGISDGSNADEVTSSGDSHPVLAKILSDPNLRGSSADGCEQDDRPQCDPDCPFRTYDGSCNNLQHPSWGSVADCLVRILPAAYEGEYGIRKSESGDPLPSPRHLTLTIFKDKDRNTPRVTLFFTVFGQVVAHDQSLSTPPVGADLPRDPGINCCPVEKAESPDCDPILVSEDDPFYSKFNITCINFLRGLECSSCKNNGKRQISNLVTGALDANIAYGTSESDADQLRTKDGTGRLKTRQTPSGELLPENTDPNLTFCPVMKTKSCFMAGDPRVNQHTYLASLQTLLVREHNRIVTALKEINPHWDDEKLYQTGRRLVDAQMQAIIFKEYFPILLGNDYMNKFNLTVHDGPPGTQYDPTLRFGSWAEYGSGTFRAHSMIPTNTGYGAKRFRDMFSNTQPILSGHMSQVLKGSCRVPSQQFDRFDVPDVTDLCYKQPGEDFGVDLMAIDVHRGRDHGLPPYVEVLNYCSSENEQVTEFDQLSRVMPQKRIDLLKSTYGSLHDVDLYVGMQMESIMDGSLLTPTAACVVGGQLYFTKYGDRFYFEHEDQAPSFTPAQRESLKNSNIARLICDNTKISSIQKNPFLFTSADNPVKLCRKLPEVDLNLWKSTD